MFVEQDYLTKQMVSHFESFVVKGCQEIDTECPEIRKEILSDEKLPAGLEVRKHYRCLGEFYEKATKGKKPFPFWPPLKC